jgi:hypothetical protein
VAEQHEGLRDADEPPPQQLDRASAVCGLTRITFVNDESNSSMPIRTRRPSPTTAATSCSISPTTSGSDI